MTKKSTPRKQICVESVMWLAPGKNGDYDMEGNMPLLEDGNATSFEEKHLVLVTEPMPEACFGINYRTFLGRYQWDKVRAGIIKEQGGKCKFCGGNERLQCHEVWKYDMKAHVQKLVDIELVCNMCHFVKHIGLAKKLANEGKLDFEAVVQHFMKVNGCPRKIFVDHSIAQSCVKMKLNECEWITDYEAWKK